jgi:hypothetical protein
VFAQSSPLGKGFLPGSRWKKPPGRIGGPGKEEGRFEVIDEDFAVHGKAYRDLSPEEWSEVRSITLERHFALNWLCGYAPNNRWDETPTDT